MERRRHAGGGGGGRGARRRGRGGGGGRGRGDGVLGRASALGRGASRSSKRAAAASEPPATPLPTGATAATRPNLPDLPAEGGIPKQLSAEIPLAKLVARAPRQLQTYWARNWARLAILGCALTYGTNFAAVKQLDHSLPPSLSASLRFGLASMAALIAAAQPRVDLAREIGGGGGGGGGGVGSRARPVRSISRHAPRLTASSGQRATS